CWSIRINRVSVSVTKSHLAISIGGNQIRDAVGIKISRRQSNGWSTALGRWSRKLHAVFEVDMRTLQAFDVNFVRAFFRSGDPHRFRGGGLLPPYDRPENCNGYDQ